MKIHSRTVLVVAVLFSNIGTSGDHLALADGASQADVVLAIDNSKSMKISDEANARIEAASQLVDTLATFTDSVSLRVGVVTFGSSQFEAGPRILQPLTQVSDPSLRDNIQAEELQGTDFKAAVCLAWATVSTQQPPSDSGCESNIPYDSAISVPRIDDPQRTRAVVLLTDGAPAPHGRELAVIGEPSSCPGESEGDVYMCELLSIWSRLTRIRPVSLYIIGLDQNDEWFQASRPYWVAMTGCDGQAHCARSVRRTTDASSLTNDILQATTGGLVNLCKDRDGSNECNLPAGVAEVQFVIGGLAESDTIVITGPDGAPRSAGPGVKTISLGGAQRWLIQAPPRGLWNVRSSNPAAQLFVESLLFPGHLLLSPIPEEPYAGQAIGIRISFVGDPEVDIPSLSSQMFRLKLEHDGSVETKTVRLRPMPNQQFLIERVIDSAGVGEWIASLEMPLDRTSLLLGSARFSVGRPATRTPTVVAREPSPTPTPLDALCTIANLGKATLDPPGPRIDPMQWSFRVARPWILPVRFLSTREQHGVWKPLDSVLCRGVDLANRPIRLRFSLRPIERGESPCVTGDPCTWEVAGLTSETVAVGGRAPDVIGKWSSIHRQLEARIDGVNSSSTWQLVAEDVVLLESSPLNEQLMAAGIGYWLPVVGLLLLLCVAMIGTAGFSSLQDYQGHPLRHYGVHDPDGNAASVMKLGVFVWQEIGERWGGGRVTLSHYLIGRPVIRRHVEEAESLLDYDEEEKGIGVRVRRWFDALFRRMQPSRVHEIPDSDQVLFDLHGFGQGR